MKQQTIVLLSKQKLLFSFVISVGFILLGSWLLSDPPKTSGLFFSNPTFVKVIGGLNLIFFGLCAFIIGRKLFDSRPGLVIDENGITDNTSAISPGLIPWTSITDISARTVWSQKFLLIGIQNPQQFIGAQKSSWKRKLLAYNHKNYGTPVSIAANSLKISFDELQQLLVNRLKLYR